MIVTLLFSLLTSFFSPTDFSVPTERWLVELKSADAGCLNEWFAENDLENAPYARRPLPVGNWWVIEVPASMSSSLHNLSCITTITADRKIEWRKQPNDPVYINQVDMNLIGMSKAWDISTGGVTAAGDTIVAALIDDGFQLDHPDLVPNIRINMDEIAGDGIDNDQNGYIDDRIGYNVSTGDDNHPLKTHGTSVAGIIGAKGNNNIGVSGVNWNVKLLLVSGANFESEVIEAYQYILDMRILYDQTGGTKGAFVVVTNLSGGINNAFAADHPLWCEMYNKLGEKGILSVTAAPNQSISVDVDGDMPTTCTSPYMIAVTNVDPSDDLVGNAGYGSTSIDIGAPGHGTITTASGSQYKEFPGTSAAAPHVAGAVALIYSTTCPEFLYDLDSNPSNTAARIRDIIFNTGKPNNTLNEITVTGKRLQVDAALRATIDQCGPPVAAGVSISSIRPNPARLQDVKVFFEVTGDMSDAFFELFSSTGAKVAEIKVDIPMAELGYLSIDAATLPAGVYLVTLRSQGKKVTRKLVVVI